jgi:transposase InsO family protein
MTKSSGKLRTSLNRYPKYVRAAVAEAFDRAIARYGKPRSITVDHDTEFTSRALDERAYRRGVVLNLIRPGKPSENARERKSGESNARPLDEQAISARSSQLS